LRDTAALVGADRCVLISRTASPVQGDKIASLNLAATLDLLLEGADESEQKKAARYDLLSRLGLLLLILGFGLQALSNFL